MIWKYFYSTSSAKEVGTMYQVRNLIGRSNVSKSHGKNFNASDDFIKLIITSYNCDSSYGIPQNGLIN